MHHTTTDNSCRERVRYCLFKTWKSVDADKSEFLNSPGLQLIEDAKPAVSSLVFTDPETKAVLFTITVDAYHAVNRIFSGFFLWFHADHQRVHVDKRIHFVKFPVLPLNDAGLNSVNDIRDCFMAEWEAVDLANNIGNIPVAGSFGIERENLFLKRTDIFCSLGYKLRLVFAHTVAWNIELNFPHTGGNRFRVASVSAVVCCFRTLAVLGVSQLGIQFCFQHILHCVGEQVLQHVLYVLNRLRVV